MSITVRKLGPADLTALRDLRLEALRLHPEFFGADLEVEEAFTPEQWLSRLSTATSLGGFTNGALNGLVVFSIPRGKKINHTGDLNAMYVRATARGSGLGDALAAALLDAAKGQVEQVKLTVNAENPRAIKFYERHGFRTIGRFPNSLRVADRTYDELIMFREV